MSRQQRCRKPRLHVPTESAPAGQSLADATAAFQRDYIAGVVKAAGGNMTEAAARLGVCRPNLYRKMRGLGLVKAGRRGRAQQVG